MIFIGYLIGLIITYFLSAGIIGWRVRKLKLERKTDKEIKQVLFWAILLWFITVPIIIVCTIIWLIIRFWKLIAAIE